MNRVSRLFLYITKSAFVRSIFIRTVSVFLIVILLLVALMSYSFGAEINRSVISDCKKQLDTIEETLSSRMAEVISISYNISQDSTFFLEPVSGAKYTGYEMSNMLARYLVGNQFIEYLAYYRLSEPEKIYTSCGEFTFHRFWDTYLHSDNYTEEDYLSLIKSNTGVRLIPLSSQEDGTTFFTYVCPLPQFSTNPQAFVIALIPFREIDPVLASQLANSHGEITVFDAGGNVIHQVCTLEKPLGLHPSVGASYAEYRRTIDGSKYIVQERVSDVNGWAYVSAVRLGDIISGLAATQVIVIAVVIALMIVAVWVILIGIVNKYEPISKLALTLTEQSSHGGQRGAIDEKSLLSSTIETLKSDSAQKQKLEVAYQEATEASKAKSTFLSNMSHDIRTPMNAIIGMTGIALKHMDDTAYVRDCLHKVEVASRYLLDIINNVLDMSRIESGKVVLAEEVVDLPKLVDGIVTIIHTNVLSKRQHLIVETDSIQNERVIGDNVRLTQICMNILSNAVKFTPDGGTIRMRISQSASDDAGLGHYEFTFSDTGIGMSPDFVEKVFDSFSRAQDSSVSQVEGTGLGMAIAKNLAELMGGSIRCDSELGVGTTFSVLLPLRFAGEAPDAAHPTNTARWKGLRVLLVGGDEAVCHSQSALFAGLGAHTDYAPDAETAAVLFAQAEDAYPYIFINPTDEDPSGVATAKRLSREARASGARCVLVATDYWAIDRATTEDAGVDVLLHAPLFRSSLLNLQAGAQASDAEASAGRVVDLTGKHVLLAEDNLLNREIARAIITETKAEVVEAMNGQEAVEIFAAHAQGYFDAILMDMQMPVMDGCEATIAIRAMERPDAAAIPIYAMTANTFDEDVQKAADAGMSGHLGKPYTPEELFRLLEQAIPR